MIRRIVLATLFAAAVSFSTGSLRAEEAVDQAAWPSEMEERLEKVEADLLDVQVKLAVARLNDRKDEAETLGKKFDAIQKERLKLLRDTGQIDF